MQVQLKKKIVLVLIIAIFVLNIDINAQSNDATKVYMKRVEALKQTSGLVAFWDFVLRESKDGNSRFLAHTAIYDNNQYVLEPRNISLEFWGEGTQATMADFPLLDRGPFGQAVQFKSPENQDDLPVLMVPREKLHDTPIDIKGPGQSVSMLIWMVYQEGNHAIAGMWHEGTDSPPKDIPARIKVRGQRQFGMFAGLAANSGSASVHISENGLSSFGDVYARHLAATKEKIKQLPVNFNSEALDTCWSVIGFVYDNKQKSITAYLNGVASEYWIDNPSYHAFYKHAANAWLQSKLNQMPGIQDGEDVNFPKDQYYSPPEENVINEQVIAETNEKKIILRNYEFTKVKTTYQKDATDNFTIPVLVELAAIKANPYWFGHDIYSPPLGEGSPFTIGRVIHSNRHATLSAYFGGVAVFNKALTPEKMLDLSKIGRTVSSPPISLSEMKKTIK